MTELAGTQGNLANPLDAKTLFLHSFYVVHLTLRNNGTNTVSLDFLLNYDTVNYSRPYTNNYAYDDDNFMLYGYYMLTNKFTKDDAYIYSIFYDDNVTLKPNESKEIIMPFKVNYASRINGTLRGKLYDLNTTDFYFYIQERNPVTKVCKTITKTLMRGDSIPVYQS